MANLTKTLGTASLGLSVAGMFSDAVGSYYGAKSKKSQLEFEASIAETNARLSETAAQQELRRGEFEIGQVTRKAGQVKGSQRASMAANGIDLGVGSAAELQASTDLMKEVDRNQIEANAISSAWGYRTQATNYQNEARMSRAGASSINAGSAAYGSLLGSAGSVSSQWYQLRKAWVLG